jgi:hypothetical protein
MPLLVPQLHHRSSLVSSEECIQSKFQNRVHIYKQGTTRINKLK